MRKKKKTGVLTFHDYDNYGAILQSYALQKKLLELGLDAELIDYSCPYIRYPFRFINLRKKGLLNYLYGVIGYICYMPRRRRCNRFRMYMNYSPSVKRKELPAFSEKYDILIAGSDQLWDCSHTNFDTTYFLDFAPKAVRKISYAVSTGEHLLPEEYTEQYVALLKNFDSILMREVYGADFVEELTGKRPECACDPTLLLTREEWTKAAGKKRIKGNYILVYQLGINPKLVSFASDLSKRTGLPVHYIPFPLVGISRGHLHLFAGPDDWMALIRDADYVISDSFHGVVFSIIFHRKFYTIVEGQHKNRRVSELLEQLGLENRILDLNGGEEYPDDIDFAACDEKLDEIRKTSMERLKKALTDKQTAWSETASGEECHDGSL